MYDVSLVGQRERISFNFPIILENVTHGSVSTFLIQIVNLKFWLCSLANVGFLTSTFLDIHCPLLVLIAVVALLDLPFRKTASLTFLLCKVKHISTWIFQPPNESPLYGYTLRDTSNTLLT